MVATSTDARLGAIRLAWWRERLDEMDQGKAPAEPRLQAVVAELPPRSVTGKELSKLEDSWLPLLQPFPWSGEQVEALKLRGRILFGIGARLLGGQSSEAEAAGALWSLVDGAKHCSDRQSRELLLDEAKSATIAGKVPRHLRPLTVLGSLAESDVHGQSGIGRVVAAAKHRLTGRFPR